MRIRIALLITFACSLASAETLTLRDGAVLEGKFFGGDSQTVRFVVDGELRSFFLQDVALIAVGPPLLVEQPKCPELTCPPAPVCPAAAEGAPPAEEVTELEETSDGVVPRGTALIVRLAEAVDSEQDPVGKIYAGKLEKSVRVGGKTILPQGAAVEAELALSDDGAAGGTSYGLQLAAITLDGQRIAIHTSLAGMTDEDGKKRISLGSIARGAAKVGRTIGGSVGQRTGRTAGDVDDTIGDISLGGQEVKVPADTILSFHLLGDLHVASE